MAEHRTKAAFHYRNQAVEAQTSNPGEDVLQHSASAQILQSKPGQLLHTSCA